MVPSSEAVEGLVGYLKWVLILEGSFLGAWTVVLGWPGGQDQHQCVYDSALVGWRGLRTLLMRIP